MSFPRGFYAWKNGGSCWHLVCAHSRMHRFCTWRDFERSTNWADAYIEHFVWPCFSYRDSWFGYLKCGFSHVGTLTKKEEQSEGHNGSLRSKKYRVYSVFWNKDDSIHDVLSPVKKLWRNVTVKIPKVWSSPCRRLDFLITLKKCIN
jgi:hypothetical protein